MFDEINERSDFESKYEKLLLRLRLRKVASLSIALVSIPIFKLARNYFTNMRGNDFYGGEFLVLLLAAILVVLVYPNYILPSKDEYLEKMSRFYSNHVDIVDIQSKDSTDEVYLDFMGYKFSAYSENGTFDIIDHENNIISSVLLRGANIWVA